MEEFFIFHLCQNHPHQTIAARSTLQPKTRLSGKIGVVLNIF
jgi:hypothetical protein